MATLTLIYDHARRELSERLTALGHEHHAHVLAALHIHLDERLCLEVMALRGRPARLGAGDDATVADARGCNGPPACPAGRFVELLAVGVPLHTEAFTQVIVVRGSPTLGRGSGAVVR